jgi:hypothetical protein
MRLIKLPADELSGSSQLGTMSLIVVLILAYFVPLMKARIEANAYPTKLC